MPHSSPLVNTLIKHKLLFNKVVPFNAADDKLLLMDFTAANTHLTDEILADTTKFSQYVHYQLQQNHCSYGIGGYNEHRTIYSRSEAFDADKYTLTKAQKQEPRRLHLGIDIWGLAGTTVYAPIGGVVHSFAFNNAFADYGATIILQHQLDGIVFHTLYGHLSLKDLAYLKEGKYISQGEVLGHFGEPTENGQWPPHLHLQVIRDMQEMKGDYPGVCRFSERAYYLKNCPDPDLILQMTQYAAK